MEPEVEVVGLAILAKGRKDLVIPLPFPANKSEVSFRLKEGSNYKLKFSFTVRHNLVSGLTYLNTVWRAGLQGGSSKYVPLFVQFNIIGYSYIFKMKFVKQGFYVQYF